MAHRRGFDTGTTFYGPLRTRFKLQNATREFSDQIFGWSPRQIVDTWWDFTGNAAGYLTGTNGTLTARTRNTPTGAAQVANSANGEASFTLAATSEAEFSGVDWADELQIPATRNIYFEAWIKMPAVAITTAQDIVIGLATAYNDTLNSVSKFVRFRFTAATGNAVLLEGKDGTVTSLAQVPDSAMTLTAATYYLFTIDGHNPGQFDFHIDSNYIGSLALPNFAATDLFQPSIGIAKASGTSAPALTMDMLRILWSRF